MIRWPYHIFHAYVYLLKLMGHYYAAPIQFEASGPNGVNVPKCLFEMTFNSP